ncbi:MAG TPA: PEP-CTERM sorting domain-containing protein, partial [Pirellulales bacterium]|nr:PEP-CTERM sorting domain-containing protein [Pirellulales bacterium]
QGPNGAQPGAYIDTFAAFNSTNGLVGPAGMVFDASGNLYVAALLGQAIVEFSPTGAFLGRFSTGNGVDGSGSFPSSLQFASDGTLLVVETNGQGIYRFDTSGHALGEFTTGGDPNAPLQVPGQMLVVPNANQWRGPAGGAWSLAANWTAGAAPNSAGEVALFWDGLAHSAAVDLGGVSWTVARIDFDTHTNPASYILQNGTIVLDGGTNRGRISAQSTNANDQTIAAAVRYANSATIMNLSAGGQVLILSGQQDWNGQTIAVEAGAVRFETNSPGLHAAGAILEISAAASVELAGHASSTSDGVEHVAIRNSGTLLATGTAQKAGNITGTGNVILGANAELTADQFVQGSLTVHGDSTHTTAKATVAASGTNSAGDPNQVSVLNSLSIDNDGAALGSRAYYGTVDLKNNDLIINSADAGTATATLASVADMARAGQSDNGLMTSSGDTITGLGVINNTNGLSTFDNVSIDANATLVKYTFFGDLNLDGKVDGNEIAAAVNGFNLHLGGWANGDANYSGQVDGNDIAAIVNAFNGQNGHNAPLPEPSTLVLAGLGLLGLFGLQSARPGRGRSRRKR